MIKKNIILLKKLKKHLVNIHLQKLTPVLVADTS